MHDTQVEETPTSRGAIFHMALGCVTERMDSGAGWAFEGMVVFIRGI
jgi:hypothetical protein